MARAPLLLLVLAPLAPRKATPDPAPQDRLGRGGNRGGRAGCAGPGPSLMCRGRACRVPAQGAPHQGRRAAVPVPRAPSCLHAGTQLPHPKPAPRSPRGAARRQARQATATPDPRARPAPGAPWAHVQGGARAGRAPRASTWWVPTRTCVCSRPSLSHPRALLLPAGRPASARQASGAETVTPASHPRQGSCPRVQRQGAESDSQLSDSQSPWRCEDPSQPSWGGCLNPCRAPGGADVPRGGPGGTRTGIAGRCWCCRGGGSSHASDFGSGAAGGQAGGRCPPDQRLNISLVNNG